MALEEFFTWGKDGRKMTPDQLAAERAALAIMQAKEGDTSPVGHWTQGMGRVVNALAGNYREGKADKAEAAGMAQGQAAMDPVLRALMGGGSGSGGYSGGPVSAASIPAWSPKPQAPGLTDVPAPTADLSLPGVAPMAPEGSGGLAFSDTPVGFGAGPITGETVVQELVQRGMPPHVAQGFAMNFADESAFNPNAVGDNGNAFGLAQWNGPRMAALQNYAAQNGTTAADPDIQLDYLMTELQGPEAGAMARIAATDTPQAAAQAVLNHFERPAESHRARREAAYAGGGMPSTSYAGGGNPITMSTQGQPAAPQGDILSLLMAAQADPWAAKQYGPVINALMGSELTNRQQAQDPLRQLQIQQAQLELQKAQMPAMPDPFTLGEGQVRYDGAGNIIATGAVKPGYVQLTPDEVAAAGLKPGAYQRGPDDKIYEIGGGGVNVTVGGEPGLGKLSTDYGYIMDPATGLPVIDPATGLPKAAPVPGSPAAIEAAKLITAGDIKGGNKETATDVITNAAKYAREADNARMVGGWAGELAAKNPGSQNAEVYRQVEALRANASAENIAAMRASSPTGAALGGVSDRDIQLLADKSGALNPASPNFARDLDDYERTVLRLVHGKDAGDRIYEATREGEDKPADGGIPTVKNDADYDLLPVGTIFIAPDGSKRKKQ